MPSAGRGLPQAEVLQQAGFAGRIGEMVERLDRVSF
jgi:hypothetical protein